MSPLKALIRPVSVRRLRFRGGWPAFAAALMLVLIYPLSLQQADWVATSDHFTWVAALALLLGTLVALGGWR